MSERFENDLDWIAMIGAFAIWSAHFMLAWAISSLFPGESAVLWLALALTIAAGIALAALWRWRKVEPAISIEALSIALAALGVIYGFLPALMA